MDLLFKSLGLNAKEKSIYLELLKIGSCSVSVLSKKTKIGRTSLYSILDRLKSLGVIASFRHKNIYHVRSMEVEILGKILEGKQKSLNRAILDFNENRDLLKTFEYKNTIVPTVHFYEGKKGILKLHNSLDFQKEFYAYFNPKAVRSQFPKLWKTMISKLPKQKLENVKELLVDSDCVDEYQKAMRAAGHKIKVLPKEIDFPTDTMICPDQVILYCYDAEEIYAIQIKSKSLAMAQKKIFELLWDSL